MYDESNWVMQVEDAFGLHHQMLRNQEFLGMLHTTVSSLYERSRNEKPVPCRQSLAGIKDRRLKLDKRRGRTFFSIDMRLAKSQVALKNKVNVDLGWPQDFRAYVERSNTSG